MKQAQYLTYTAWSGQLNNVRMSFECAVVLAFLLGRKLVISTSYESNGAPWVTPWMVETFDLSLLREALPLVCPSDRNYSKVLQDLASLPGGETLVFDPYPREHELPPDRTGEKPARSVFCFPGFPPDGTPEFTRLGQYAAGRYALRLPRNHDRYRRVHMTPTLEHFYTYFFLEPELEATCKRLIRDHLKFRPEIVRAADAMIARLGTYSAAHIRRGDFQVCRPNQCFASNELAQVIRANVPAGTKLYVATNERDRQYFDGLRKSHDVVLFEDVAGGSTRLLPAEWIAAVEMLVAVKAEIFVGTMLSTYSGYITRLRGYLGARDQVFRFTDGTTDARPPTSEYSWRETVRAGTPLWGREYHEGWST